MSPLTGCTPLLGYSFYTSANAHAKAMEKALEGAVVGMKSSYKQTSGLVLRYMVIVASFHSIEFLIMIRYA